MGRPLRRRGPAPRRRAGAAPGRVRGAAAGRPRAGRRGRVGPARPPAGALGLDRRRGRHLARGAQGPRAEGRRGRAARQPGGGGPRRVRVPAGLVRPGRADLLLRPGPRTAPQAVGAPGGPRVRRDPPSRPGGGGRRPVRAPAGRAEPRVPGLGDRRVRRRAEDRGGPGDRHRPPARPTPRARPPPAGPPGPARRPPVSRGRRGRRRVLFCAAGGHCSLPGCHRR